jgi:tetratricopeptide (TPR) repeat protein
VIAPAGAIRGRTDVSWHRTPSGFEQRCRAVMGQALGDVSGARSAAEMMLAEAGEDPSHRVLATVALSHAASYSGELSEAVSLLEGVAPLAGRVPAHLVSLLYNAMVQPLLRLGRVEEARRASDAAVSSSRRDGSAVEIAKTLVGLGAVQRAQGLIAEAAETLAEAGRLAEEAPIVSAAAASNRAECLLDDERFDAALEAFSWAAERFASAGHRHAAAIAKGNIADLLGRLGRLDAAGGAFESARRAFEATGAVLDVARLSCEEAEMLAGAGALRAARDRYALALPVLESASAGADLMRARVALAGVLLDLGDSGGAREQLLRAGDSVGEPTSATRAVIEHGLARCDAAEQRWTGAQERLERALELAGGRVLRRVRILLSRAELLLSTDQPQAARACAESCIVAASEAGLFSVLPLALGVSARCDRRLGDVRAACGTARSAAAIAERMLSGTSSASARNGLARLFAPVFRLAGTLALDAGADGVAAILTEDAFAPRLAGPATPREELDPDRRRLLASLDRVSQSIARVTRDAGANSDQHRSGTLHDLHAQAALLADRLGTRVSGVSVPTAEQIAARLPQGAAVLHWFVEDGSLSLLRLGHESEPVVHRRLAGLEAVRACTRRLALLAERAAHGVGADDRGAWTNLVSRLRGLLLPEAVRRGWPSQPDRGHVYVSAPPEATGVPWSAVLGGAWVGGVSEISGLGTVMGTVLGTVPDHGPVRPLEPTVVLLAAGPSVLPAAQREVESAAAHWRGPVVRVGGVAEELLPLIASADVLHMATHGVFEPDRPASSRLWIGDRWVSIGELSGHLRAGAVVVLSACHAGRAGGLAEDRVAIPFALGHRGVVVAPIWPLGDAAASALFSRFYGHLSGSCRTAAGVARALRAALAESLEQCPSSQELLGLSVYGGVA